MKEKKSSIKRLHRVKRIYTKASIILFVHFTFCILCIDFLCVSYMQNEILRTYNSSIDTRIYTVIRDILVSNEFFRASRCNVIIQILDFYRTLFGSRVLFRALPHKCEQKLYRDYNHGERFFF